VSETRVKVYRTPAEMQADAADAALHGWVVSERTIQPDGTMRVAYQQQGRSWAGGIVGPEPAGTGTPSLLGLVLILTVVIAVAILLGFGR